MTSAGVLDDLRVVEPVAEDHDSPLEQPLLVLCGVVLEVLREIAVGHHRYQATVEPITHGGDDNAVRPDTRVVDSRDGDVSFLREGEPGRVPVLRILYGAALSAWRDDRSEGAEGGVGAVLRSGRLHGHVGAR